MASRVSVYGIGALRAPYGILRSGHLRRLDSIPSSTDSIRSHGERFHTRLWRDLQGFCLAFFIATPTCMGTSTRLGANWLTLDEKHDIINSPINKNL